MSSSRVLVTGGAGFIGSHLCEALLHAGHEVLCVDNLYSSSKSNIMHLLGNPRFEFIRHDVTLPLFVEADEIYHLACPASPVHYQRDPVHTTKTAVLGSINMLGLAKRLKIKILQASTSEVYGSHPHDPVVYTEDSSSRRPLAEGFARDSIDIEGYARGLGRRAEGARVRARRGPQAARADGDQRGGGEGGPERDAVREGAREVWRR